MITKTQPGAPISLVPKPTKPEKPIEEDPKTLMLQRKKEQIDRQLSRHTEQQQKYREQQEKQEQFKRAQRIARNFLKTAAPPDPNKNPSDLYLQIKGTLNDIGLKSTMVESKAFIYIDKTINIRGNEMYMYKVSLRQNANVNRDTVRKLNSDHFISMGWTSKAIEAYIYGPYTPPAAEEPGEAPAPEGVV